MDKTFRASTNLRSLSQSLSGKNWIILKELFHVKKIATFALLSSIVGAVLTSLTVGLLASFIQGITNPNEAPIHTGIAWVDVWFLATKATATERIYRLSALILATVWLKSLFTYWGKLYSKLTVLHLVDRLKKRMFDQLQSVNLSFFTKTRTGSLINSLGGEINKVSQAFEVFTVFITQGLTLIAYGLSMIVLSWQLTLIAVAIFSTMSMCLSKTITKRVRQASFEIPKANKELISRAIEFISGIRTVHAYATHDYERDRFYHAAEQVYETNAEVAKLSTIIGPIVQGVSTSIIIVFILLAFSFFIDSGQLRPAILITFLFVLSRSTPMVSTLTDAKAKFDGLQGSIYNVRALLKRDDKPYFIDGSRELKEFKRSIDLVGVDFEYELNEPILKKFTLSIQRGKTTAIVGASGAGKSTLVDLIPRFMDPTRGQVLIDGIDLRELSVKTLRSKMAIVSQDTYIFNASVRHNIAYGLKTVDDSTLKKVAEQARALEFILKLPEGFDTILGDRGVRLSGGQRQRIAIARALLRDPEILILDEATSALDSVTEKAIQESIEKLASGRTTIAIAHRLSTITQADLVVVLEKGQIVEQGSYQDLLDRGGELWKYHQMQNRIVNTIKAG
jgi:subfamily B ATP-binding cassette protein MsbA